MDETAGRQLLYACFPFIIGIYPYAGVTEKQKSALRQAGIPCVHQSACGLTYPCLIKRLNGKET